MRLLSRKTAGIATLALILVGCGGSSGSQSTSSPIRTFKVASAAVYGADAAAVGTVDDSATRAIGVQSIIPLATLTSETGQLVVLWGTRDDAGRVTSVREAAYRDGDVTLYARYAANGGILSVLGANAGTNEDPALTKNAGSYVTFGALEEPGLSSITGSGVVFTDGVQSDSSLVRATLTDNGVTVREIDGRTQRLRVDALLKAPVARADGNDPLDGFSTVYQEAENRTKIIASLLKVAGIVVDKPYSTYISNSASFLFLDQLSKSYTGYTAQGFAPTSPTDATTPLPYRADLP